MSDAVKKKQLEHFQKQITREIPSQVPFHVVRATYDRMILHCLTQNVAVADLWACSKNGAKVHAKVWYRNVWNRDGSLNAAHIPVAYLFCSGCDKPPAVGAGDPLYVDQIQTLSM